MFKLLYIKKEQSIYIFEHITRTRSFTKSGIISYLFAYQRHGTQHFWIYNNIITELTHPIKILKCIYLKKIFF